jgi:hypothetical protein
MDFMLMMGVAGEGAKADHVDSLDLFHTMEAYFTWYPEGSGLERGGFETVAERPPQPPKEGALS